MTAAASAAAEEWAVLTATAEATTIITTLTMVIMAVLFGELSRYRLPAPSDVRHFLALIAVLWLKNIILGPKPSYGWVGLFG